AERVRVAARPNTVRPRDVMLMQSLSLIRSSLCVLADTVFFRVTTNEAGSRGYSSLRGRVLQSGCRPEGGRPGRCSGVRGQSSLYLPATRPWATIAPLFQPPVSLEPCMSSAPASRDLANAIRALSMDAVQQANSGHPGAPMGMADIAEVLWRRFLKHNPGNPQWPDRDRFVLSNGHGSMLLYSLLHLTGYGVSLEDIKNFRQLGSPTAGHPEYGDAPGIETTTGPLGQGIANAVGMALAEKVLAAQFNREGHRIVDHHTYCFLGDGCMMEGISHEVASLAGTLG